MCVLAWNVRCRLVIKQGIHATTAGRGALSAAVSNLEALICAAMPVLYGWLIVVFTNPKTPAWLRWGPGGHFFVAAALRLVSWCVMRSIDMRLLHIDDVDHDHETADGKPRGNVLTQHDADGFQLPMAPSPR